jgi:hypothetical protein
VRAASIVRAMSHLHILRGENLKSHEISAELTDTSRFKSILYENTLTINENIVSMR